MIFELENSRHRWLTHIIMKLNIEKKIQDNFKTIQSWLTAEKSNGDPLFYTSVDLRESDYKYASIDTNIFPAGFNNLPPSNNDLIKTSIKTFIDNHYPNTTHILLFSEDHTRNSFYLEHIYQLSERIKSCGINCSIGTFFKDHPSICTTTGFLNLSTSSKNQVTIFCLDYILNNRPKFPFDLCLLNNDLSDGKYESLTNLRIPLSLTLT